MIEYHTLEQTQKWMVLEAKLSAHFKKKADLNAILFLIGVQELGQGAKVFSKEEKQDLMHIAICKILSYSGYYVLEGADEQGWPHWRPAKKLPFLDLTDQEDFMKFHLIEYFEKETDFFE